MRKILGTNTARNKEKKKINVRMPIKMIDEINQVIGRNKSSWICSALNSLSDDEYYRELILEEWIEAGQNKSVQFSLTNEAYEALTKMASSISDEIKEPISPIIRCAATQALIRNKKQGVGVRPPAK